MNVLHQKMFDCNDICWRHKSCFGHTVEQYFDLQTNDYVNRASSLTLPDQCFDRWRNGSKRWHGYFALRGAGT
jgi:hypothetical protein